MAMQARRLGLRAADVSRAANFQLDPPAQSRSRERPVSARLARYGLAHPMAQDQKPRLLAERGERRAVQQGAACAFGALAVEIKRLVPPPGGGSRPLADLRPGALCRRKRQWLITSIFGRDLVTYKPSVCKV